MTPTAARSDPGYLASAISQPRLPSRLGLAVMLTLLAIGVRALGLQRTFRLVNRMLGSRPLDWCVDLRYLEAVAHRIAAIAAFLPGRVRCLEQSLALYASLRQKHIDASLKVGVQPYPFLAHAWVEYHGQPVAETWDKVSTFVPMDGWQT